MSTYREKRDQRIADDHGQDRALMCRAQGCPNRWSVDAGNGKCCSAHAWSDPHHWPQITQEQLDAETDRAMRRQYPAQRIEAPRFDIRKLRESIGRLAEAMRGNTKAPKLWAHRLKAREQAGEPLSDHQRKAWREALHRPAKSDAEDRAAA